MTNKEPRRVIGDAKCGMCGQPVKVRITEKNKLYANCIEAQGGCGAQVFSRSAAADKHLATSIEKWMDPNERRAYLGEEALPQKARPPAPAPAPAPQSAPQPEAEADTDEPDAEAEPEAAPPPPPRASKPKTKRPVPPQFQKPQAKPWWAL